MWVTQALRNIDVMTDQGRSFLVFLGITRADIPDAHHASRADCAPDRVAHVLTKLGNDSE